jgi:hypothetical protein
MRYTELLIIQILCEYCYTSVFQVRWMPPPLTRHPRGGSMTKIQKNLPARRASERPWSGGPSFRVRFNMKMQSLFHPVWLSPNENHVRFHGSGMNSICLFPFCTGPKSRILTNFLFRNKNPINGAKCCPLFPVHLFSRVNRGLYFLELYTVLHSGNRE